MTTATSYDSPHYIPPLQFQCLFLIIMQCCQISGDIENLLTNFVYKLKLRYRHKHDTNTTHDMLMLDISKDAKNLHSFSKSSLSYK